MGNLQRNVWEGWTPQNFIDALSDEIKMIMDGESWQKPFKTKEEMVAYIVGNQPYYKKPIPEVNEYFLRLYNIEKGESETMDKQFCNLGSIVVTRAVSDFMEKHREFNGFIIRCLERYQHCDWGDLCDEDTETNDDAVSYGDRILASYNFPPNAAFEHPDGQLWIITEWDRSVTTILFPSDY